MTSPAAYWRTQQKVRALLGQKGQLVSITGAENGHGYWGVIKLPDQKITSAVISNTRPPKIGDPVVGVLRILHQDGRAGLIEYGVKFQLADEVK